MTRFEDYLRWRCGLDDPFLELDLSVSGLDATDLEQLSPGLDRALDAMAELEAGGIANRDEQRMVGHYWLRAPQLAPDEATSEAIAGTLEQIVAFAAAVHSGQIAPPDAERFRRVLVAGIGGSALGPMLVADCFRETSAPMTLTVLDNTDPAGIDTLLGLHGDLRDTLIVVISKSGGTAETRNGMLELRAACEAQGLSFAPRAVAVTGDGSALAQRAASEDWLRTLPMWDWVGGRFSLWSAVGLLPAALIGLDLQALLAGAAAMDSCTRSRDLPANPAAMLALLWFRQGEGRGGRDAIVLPYKDSLLLFSRYLQQLVMESLGKQLDRQGREVWQGLAVYGNKGSTDQHAFVQQLRDGVHNFFVMFVRVLEDRSGPSIEVEAGATSGDFLDGFWLGTRAALAERGRDSATITLRRVDERSFGALLALFERAVGLYAELIDVNAYHQPGVEAGKRAAGEALAVQARILAALTESPQTVVELAAQIEAETELVWQIGRHLAANREGVRLLGADDPATATLTGSKAWTSPESTV